MRTLTYKEYDLKYKEFVYSIWYTSGRPSISRLYDLIPADNDEGYERPAITTIKAWYTQYGWESRADLADTEVVKATDRELIKVRLDMMARHAQQAKEIANKAYTMIVSEGFDSSASAVTAWVKAVEEEKKSTGMQIALTEVFSLPDDDLKKKLDQYLNRLTNVGGVTITNPAEDVVDAVSSEESTY